MVLRNVAPAPMRGAIARFNRLQDLVRTAVRPSSLHLSTLHLPSLHLRWSLATLPGIALSLALAVLLSGLDGARAQQGRGQPGMGLREQGPPPSAPAAPEPAPPAREENPGLIHEMGKLFDKMLPSNLLPPSGGRQTAPSADAAPGRPVEQAKDAPQPAAPPAKSSGIMPSTMVPSTMVSGRSVCPLSASRTPDCKAGADKLCQSKGYKEGKSLNTDAAESCSAKVLIPGRERKPDDCRTDTYVTSALCQ